MRTLVLRVVAEPPQVFWAPLMPAAGNVLINITAMLFGIMGFNVKALGLRGLPTTLIIDREGREIARIEGEAPWDSAETLARFETMLAGS